MFKMRRYAFFKMDQNIACGKTKESYCKGRNWDNPSGVASKYGLEEVSKNLSKLTSMQQRRGNPG
jgi:hypothetical protein